MVWMLKGGGLFSDTEVPSHRFNVGEKVLLWGGVLFLGLIVVGSGLVLDMLIPGFVYERGTMQIANMIHGVAALFMMAMFIGHICCHARLRGPWCLQACRNDCRCFRSSPSRGQACGRTCQKRLILFCIPLKNTPSVTTGYFYVRLKPCLLF